MEILNSEGFIRKMCFTTIRIYSIQNSKENFLIYKSLFLCEKGKILCYFCCFFFLKYFQISEIQFLFKTRFEVNEKQIFSSEKIRNVGD